MDYNGINVILIVSLVIIGSVPCTSDECTLDKIWNCATINFNDNNSCAFYNKTVTCLEEIEPKCKDDQLILRLTILKKDNIAKGGRCPGLPEGDCYFNAIKQCEKMIPFDLAHSRRTPEDEKQKMCDEFELHLDSAKICLENIKEVCVGKHSRVRRDYRVMKEIEEVCELDD